MFRPFGAVVMLVMLSSSSLAFKLFASDVSLPVKDAHKHSVIMRTIKLFSNTDTHETSLRDQMGVNHFSDFIFLILFIFSEGVLVWWGSL